MSNNIFRVASFNLFNLVLPNQKYYGKRVYSEDIYDKKIEWVGQQLDNMQPDVIGFQEVFHEEALKEAIAKSEYLKNAHILTANPTGERPVVALASKYPILEHEVIEEFPEILDIEGTNVPIKAFSRPVLKAKIKIDNKVDIVVFVSHLKSKRPMFEEGANKSNPIERAKGQARSLIRRATEATALRTLLMKELEHREQAVVVVGDLNDDTGSVTTRLILGEPPFRNMDMSKKKKIWDVLLYHVKEIQARRSFHDFYYSHIHNGHYESLDHIMVSEELVAENPNHIGRIGYVSILNDHLVDETLSDEGVKAWQSDHAQVVATVELRNS